MPAEAGALVRYGNPEAFKMALEQRLRNRALATGRSLQRLRQLVVFERFLARLFGTVGDDAVLKGGLVVELRAARARTTKDIDLRLRGDPRTVLERLQKAGRLNMEDYFSFQIEPDRRNPELKIRGLQHEGRRYRVTGSLAGKIYGSRFQVDVALAEPLVAPPERVLGPDFLSFAGIKATEVWLYSVEAHLAEKLHAYTLDRDRENTRVKDLPDLALLAGVKPLESVALRRALELTFQNRATHPLPASVPDPPEAWSRVYEAMAREDGLAWTSITELMASVRTFLEPILADPAGSMIWEPEAWRWNP